MKSTLALTLLSAISATHARVNIFYSDDLSCSKVGTQYRLGDDSCRDYAAIEAIHFSKVKRSRKVCLHRFREKGCMDAGEPAEIQLGGDSIVYTQCEPIEGDWKSYYISQGGC